VAAAAAGKKKGKGTPAAQPAVKAEIPKAPVAKTEVAKAQVAKVHNPPKAEKHNSPRKPAKPAAKKTKNKKKR
jgi:hypothetical protein